MQAVRKTGMNVVKKVNQLQREGWCLVEQVIPKDKVDRVRTHVQEANAEALCAYDTMGTQEIFRTPNETRG